MRLQTVVLLAVLPTLSAGAEIPARTLPFQARIAAPDGAPAPDGAVVIRFQIFGTASDPVPVWNGEVHRTTVNRGLINVILGTKGSLDGVDFGRTLYLELTPDTAGAAGSPDGQVTEADPPMRPRQVLVPVHFAAESAISRDSRKLAGHDWTPLFGANDPVGGRIPGAKLVPASVGTDQLTDGSVTRTKLGIGAVVESGIQDSAVGTAKLADGAVTTAKIADGAVTGSKIGGGAVDATRLQPGLFRAATYSWNNSGGFDTYNTGVSSSLWYPVLTGFDFGVGDLNENDVGSLLELYFSTSGGRWIINAGIRTHNNSPNMTVQVLWIPRTLVSNF